ncbi:disulfide oxidoreductase [Metabacillus malikii]|uniref:Probable disulfide formation protein n=1 Tax=Metabacillus malikii TaxID=1504265 RepID=A0ABT9ZJB6_9BACI|nr:disulfide oxidoreductase [Metabacillus malikii]MDQ0232366.1 disulfide bond formation protein DsbB [Metabacillus malikii]
MSSSRVKAIENLLTFAWITSFVATLGSLYFSEILQYTPCELCWYQRIFMYPLVIILGIGVFKKDAKAARYSLLLSAIGGCISLYHYGIQKIDFLGNNSIECGIVPCTGEYINWLGFITIPFLALIAFIIIFVTSITILKKAGR